MTELDEKTMHSQIMQLLPWYVNQTVKDNDRQLIEAHLRSCVSCRIELKHQKLFANKVKYSSDFGFAPRQSFSLLKSRIQQSSDSPASEKIVHKGQNSFPAYWLKIFNNTLRNSLFRPQTAFVAIGICLLLFSINLIVVNENSVSKNQFRTLSTPEARNGLLSNDIRVVFEPTITQEQIQHVVLSTHARVIEGPSSSGVFRIRANDIDGQNQPSIDQLLQMFRARKEVIFVEPTYAALNSMQRK